MNEFATVIFEKREGIAWLTLDRPQVMNAMNTLMRDELWTVMEAVRDDPDTRVLIVRGAGERAFSAGADVGEFGTAPSYVEARLARRERDLWQLMLDLDKPLIAAIHGYALGAGCEMSMCCDLRVASENARFGLPEVKLGYIPSAGGTQLLPRTGGPGLARELILTGDDIDAATALRLGLVHTVVARERLYDEAEAWARELMTRSPAVLRYAKEAVTRGLEVSLEEGLTMERRLGRLLTASGV